MIDNISLPVENNDDLKDNLLLIERANVNLDLKKEKTDEGDEEYVLEGTFAEFGTKNSNNRIYDEKDYLPHLSYLQEKMDKNSLMGELDHPAGFSTSLQNVSHIVEKLEYNKASRTIQGRVRILDTPAGKTAKTIIDAGVPISISSRAAGVADPRDGHVTLKKIVTYDLVADPGFESATLSKVSEHLQLMNESYGLTNDDNLQIYKILEDNNIDIDSNEDLKNDLLTIEKTNTNDTKNKDSIMEDNTKMVTEEQLEKYSEMVKKVWEGLEAKLEDAEKEIEDLKETIENREDDEPTDLTEEVNHLRSLVTEHIKYINEELVETINDIGTATDTNAKVLNEQIEYSTLLEQFGNDMAGIMNENVDTFKSFKNYTDNEIVGKMNESYEMFESFKNYTDNEIVGKMNESYEMLESFKNYTDNEIVGKINEGIEHQNLLIEGLKQNDLKLDDKLFEDVNPDGSDPSGFEEELAEEETADEIIEKIKEEVEEVEKEKALEESLKQYPFHSVMNEATTEIFAKLDESKKETVREQFMAKPLLVESYVSELIENVSKINEEKVEVKWLAEAPVAYKKLYEKLDFNAKENLNTRAKAFNLDTPYQINNFWTTSGLDKLDENYQGQTAEIIKLNEENDLKVSETLGYSSKQVNKIKSGLKRFNS